MFGIGFKHAHYAELLENSSRYVAQVDFLEVHSENFFGSGGAAKATLAKAREQWPISLHGVGLALGSATGLDSWHLDQLADLVERTEPLLVSDHACYARGYVPSRAAELIHACDLLPIPFSKPQLAKLCSNVNQVQERLKQTIAVENLSAYFVWREDDFSETEFLTQLTQATGCKLLVDVNNIYVNALNRIKTGDTVDAVVACCAWLDGIAKDLVAEIHVAGHKAMDDIVIDDHSCAVSDEVWQIYQHAIRRFGITQTLVEWDTDVPSLHVLIEQADKARAIARELM